MKKVLFVFVILFPILLIGSTDLVRHELARDYDYIIFGDTNEISITASADIDTLYVPLIEIAHYNFQTSVIFGTDSVDAYYKEAMTIADLDSISWVVYDELGTDDESIYSFCLSAARYLKIMYVVYTKSAEKFHWRIGLWRY